MSFVNFGEDNHAILWVVTHHLTPF